MNEQQIHELIGRLTVQIEALRLALVAVQSQPKAKRSVLRSKK
jgi:hypothetical protein